MEWSAVGFGKYRGKSLPQIMFTDADRFFNGYQQGESVWYQYRHGGV